MRKVNKNHNEKSVAFQSDIVIDNDGNLHISFLGPDLLHLLDKDIEINETQDWSLPPKESIKQVDFRNSYVKCQLCPKDCKFNRVDNKHPLCGDWKLRVSNYGISFGDEDFISSGGGSGIIFLSGCPLTCPSCINPEKVREQGKSHSPYEFAELAKNLYLKGVNNIQILSPTVHLPQLQEALKILKRNNFPIPIIYKTSGYDTPEQLKKLEGLIDIFMPDFKPCTSATWRSKASVKENFQSYFEDSIKQMSQQLGMIKKDNSGLIEKGVVIRYIITPYISPDENRKILDYLNSFSDIAEISIQDNFLMLE